MASYVVLEPPAAGVQGVDTVFVRDGFSVLAFLVPVLWLFWYRLWLEATAALALTAGLAALSRVDGFAAAPFLSLLVAIYVGLEGAALRIAALGRRGWKEVGVIEADSQADVELRYLSGDRDSSETAPWRLRGEDSGPPARPSYAAPAGLLFSPGRG